MKAKEYLLQVKKLDRMINNKLIEIEMWKSIASGTSAKADGERVQSSSNQQKMEDAICKYISIESELDADIDRLVNIKMEVISTIEQLKVDEYDVLHKEYIQYKELDEIAEDMEKTYSWVTTIKGKALKNLQDILDERELIKALKKPIIEVIKYD